MCRARCECVRPSNSFNLALLLRMSANPQDMSESQAVAPAQVTLAQVAPPSPPPSVPDNTLEVSDGVRQGTLDKICGLLTEIKQKQDARLQLIWQELQAVRFALAELTAEPRRKVTRGVLQQRAAMFERDDNAGSGAGGGAAGAASK